MKTLLRLIGVLAGSAVVATAFFISRFAGVGLKPLLASGALGAVTILGWLVTFIAGPIAFVQLLRVRNSGRIAAIVLFGYMLTYYLVGLFAFRQPEAPATPIIQLCMLLALLVAALLLPFARRTCIAAFAQDDLEQ
jgi:hypothetical protein